MQPYTALDDHNLARLLADSDQAAYTELYNRYHAALYIHVFNKLGNREEARDIVHNLFSALWEKREQITITSSLAAYLYTAARYQVFDLIAHRQVASSYIKSIGVFAESQECITDFSVREKQLMELIEKEIAALPPKMREVFELSRKGYLSHREIARQLNLSEQTVKKQVNNSLKLLRARLGTSFFSVFLF